MDLIALTAVWISQHRVSDLDLALLALIAGQQHEVTDRPAADVIVGVIRSPFAHRTVQVGGTQAGQHRMTVLEQTPDQGPGQVDEAEPTAQT